MTIEKKQDLQKNHNIAYQEAYHESYTKGRLQGKLYERKLVLNLLKRGKLSIEEIAEDFEVDVAFVLALQNEII